MSSPLVRVCRDLVNPLSGTGQEIPLQMEISLTNVNVSYKRSTPTWFLEPVYSFSENNQLKTIDTPKKHNFRWKILLH